VDECKPLVPGRSVATPRRPEVPVKVLSGTYCKGRSVRIHPMKRVLKRPELGAGI